MKFEEIRKKLIVKGGICAGIVIALGAGYYFITDYNNALSENIQRLKSEKVGAQSDAARIDKEVNDASAAFKFYETFKSSKDADPQSFRREEARRILNELHSTLGLIKVEFNMGAFEKVVDAAVNGPVVFYSTTVTVQFFATSDIKAFNFIKGIKENFPGMVKIKSYKIDRAQQINNDLIMRVSNGGIGDGTVTGQIVFEWHSIQDNPDYNSANPNAPAQVPGRPPGFNPPRGLPNG